MDQNADNLIFGRVWMKTKVADVGDLVTTLQGVVTSDTFPEHAVEGTTVQLASGVSVDGKMYSGGHFYRLIDSDGSLVWTDVTPGYATSTSVGVMSYTFNPTTRQVGFEWANPFVNADGARWVRTCLYAVDTSGTAEENLIYSSVSIEETSAVVTVDPDWDKTPDIDFVAEFVFSDGTKSRTTVNV